MRTVWIHDFAYKLCSPRLATTVSYTRIVSTQHERSDESCPITSELTSQVENLVSSGSDWNDLLLTPIWLQFQWRFLQFPGVLVCVVQVLGRDTLRPKLLPVLQLASSGFRHTVLRRVHQESVLCASKTRTFLCMPVGIGSEFVCVLCVCMCVCVYMCVRVCLCLYVCVRPPERVYSVPQKQLFGCRSDHHLKLQGEVCTAHMWSGVLIPLTEF